MMMRSALCAVCAMAFAAPALAAPTCLANGKSYGVGEQACLVLASGSHLARCDMVLNNTSWTKIGDQCSAIAPDSQPTSSPAPDAQTGN